MMQKAQLKAIYKRSAHDVCAILNVFSEIAKNPTRLPTAEDTLTMQNTLKNIFEQHAAEEESEYKKVIFSITEWLIQALSYHYLVTHGARHNPPLVFTLYKGLKLLHVLLHHDLRRRQLSPEELTLLHEFVELTEVYPNPENESQQELCYKASS